MKRSINRAATALTVAISIAGPVPAHDAERESVTPKFAQALANLTPALDFPRPAITDGTDHVRPATLRGLAPDQTLVLVNGMRAHVSALVAVNTSIGREYQIAHDHFGFNEQELLKITRNAIEEAFIDPAARQTLLLKLENTACRNPNVSPPPPG